MKNSIFLISIALLAFGCNSNKIKDPNSASQVSLEVNPSYFTSANDKTSITSIACTLSDGTKTNCYQIVTNSTPTDHPMGPWCPQNIEDGDDKGGIWLKDGKAYDVDGTFIKNLAALYKDDTWKMYDTNGNIYVTKTEEDCINAANPQVGEEYKNFCVECLPSYIDNMTSTYLIPTKPVMTTEPVSFMGRGGGPGAGPGGDKPPRGERPPRGDGPPKGDRPSRDKGGIPATRGVALNGVEFSAPAPLNNILSAYTIAPFDDAGGHINVHQGYHYHTATGVSFSIKQKDGHAPLIGYAMDGHGIYGLTDELGKEATDLDECRGHYDAVRGYHYHVDDAGNNNFINCLHGAYVQ